MVIFVISLTATGSSDRQSEGSGFPVFKKPVATPEYTCAFCYLAFPIVSQYNAHAVFKSVFKYVVKTGTSV